MGLADWCPPGASVPRLAPAPLVTGPHSWTDVTPSPIPTSYPSARTAPAMTFDAATNSVLLFGGLGVSEQPPYSFVILQDTWSFAQNVWTPLIANSTCTATSCPPPIIGASLAYDAADREAILFGGEILYNLSATPFASDQTWAFASGHWTNLTSSAGTPPPAREAAMMTYDSGDGYVLLFGGTNATGADLGDTWVFSAGHWTNRTASLSRSPEPRDDAAIADSPTGYVLLFGGENNGSVIQGDCLNGTPFLMWWYHAGAWSPAAQEVNCIPVPGPHLKNYTAGQAPPCGRVGAGLGWSPLNHEFVLFGGEGIPGSTTCTENGTLSAFNDTWDYIGPPGGPLYPTDWFNDLLPGPPSPRYGMGYASDFRDGAFVIFGGVTGFLSITNETWRYYQALTVSLKGPLVIQATALGFDLFTMEVVGGTGDLTYRFLPVRLLKTSHPLTGTGSGCQVFNNGTTIPVGRGGILQLPCSPDATAYNIFELSVVAGDLGDLTKFAYANWTFTVDPPETIHVYSKYTGIFYSGFSFSDIFGVYAQIGNQPVSTVVGNIGGTTVPFSGVTNGSPYWWNSTFNLESVYPWQQLEVVASSSDWSENATLYLRIVSTPDWMQQIQGFISLGESQSSWGKGPWNESYALLLKVPLPIGKLFNFSLPVPLISGNYSLIPSLELDLNESSTGNITLSGTLSLAPPGIDLGAFSLNITITLTVTGTFSIVPVGDTNSTIVWDSASLAFGLTADFSASIPIYGFSFSILGHQVKIGFNLDIDIAPSFALTILMAPTKNMSADVGNGLGLAIVGLLGHFSLPLKVDLSFGIGIASVAIGGTLSVDMIFQFAPPPFEISNIWVNGSVFVTAQFLFWSATWNFVGPGVIYHYMPTFLGPLLGAHGVPGSGYDNGSNASWSLASRSYNSSGYDSLHWVPSNASGAAITDIYPNAEPSAAAAYNGAYLFYSDDDVARPVNTGLSVSGASLSASTNMLAPTPHPSDPGFVVAHPVASTRPDGSLYVLWEALPTGEAGGSSPAAVQTVALHGAPYYPNNDTWGPVHVWSSSGVVQSYGLDPSVGGRVVALVSGSLLPSQGTTEWLEAYNLSSGALVGNATVSGFSAIVSVRAGAGLVLLRDLEGNYSLAHLSPGASFGAPATLGYAPGPNRELVGAEFVPGTVSTLLLHYRSKYGGSLVLYDASAGQTIASLAVGGNVSDAHALYSAGTYFVYASTHAGYVGWSWAGSAWSPLPSESSDGATGFGLSQAGGSLLLYAVVAPANGSSGGDTLYLVQIPAGLSSPPVPASVASTSPGGGGSSTSGPNYALYLAIAAAAVAVLLIAVAVIWGRAKPPAPPAAPTTAPPPGTGG